MNERTENIRYAALLGVHTMMTCPAISFVAPYLNDAQISARTVGIVVAVSCLLAVGLQQFVGRLVDRNIIDGRKLLLRLAAAMTLAAVSLVGLNISGGGKAVLFGAMYCLTFVMLPVLNSFSFFYENRGVSVNYGAARGCGSISFAACSVVLGYLVAQFGTDVVPLTFGILTASLFAILLTMPTLKGNTSGAQTSTLKLTKFPAFRMMLIGASLILLFHNMLMTYFIYAIENVGGDSSDMGVALGLAAALELPVLFLYTRIKGNTPSKIFLTASGVAFFVKAALFVFAQSVTMIYLVQCLQIISYGLMAAARVYYVDETIGKKHEATGQAYMAATEPVGLVLGSLLGGFLMDGFGIGALLWCGAIVSFVGAACMIQSCRR